MYNILPGQGLGFTASKEIAFGLGYSIGVIVEKIYREFIRLKSHITKSITLTSKIWR